MTPDETFDSRVSIKADEYMELKLFAHGYRDAFIFGYKQGRKDSMKETQELEEAIKVYWDSLEQLEQTIERFEKFREKDG